MYLDKKIANEVEIVQTLSRLNRTFPGKDQTFVIDFVNEPEAIGKAFARYDAGAMLEEVQDLNVIYDMKTALDREGIYEDAHLLAFREARFQTARKIAAARDPEHKAMFAATQIPTDAFNGRIKVLRKQTEAAEAAYQIARQADNHDGMKQADHDRKQIEGLIAGLNNFKSGLARFSRTYAYIAQLIDLGEQCCEVGLVGFRATIPSDTMTL